MEAFRLYMDLAERHGLARPKATDSLLWSLAAVLKQFDGLDGWRRALARIEALPALRGIDNGAGAITVSLFWFTKNGGENLNKLLSGECDNWFRSRSAHKSGKVVF